MDSLYKVLAIDIDDTSQPLHKIYLPWAIKHKGYYPDATLSNTLDYDHSTICSHSPDQIKEFFMEFYETPEFKKIRPYPLFIKVAKQLIGEGRKINFVTSKPASTESITKEQFSELEDIMNFNKQFHFAKHMYNNTSGTKEEIIESLGADLFIDDFPGHIKRVTSKGVDSLLFDKPWNRYMKLPYNAERTYSWPHVNAIIHNDEKLFRFLMNHPITKLLPLYGLKAYKKRKLIINPDGIRYENFNIKKANWSLGGGCAIDLGIISIIAGMRNLLGSEILNFTENNIKELAEYVSKIPREIVQGFRDSIQNNAY